MIGVMLVGSRVTAFAAGSSRLRKLDRDVVSLLDSINIPSGFNLGMVPARSLILFGGGGAIRELESSLCLHPSTHLRGVGRDDIGCVISVRTHE